MEPTGKGKRGRVDERVAQEEAAKGLEARKHEAHVTGGKGDGAVGRDSH